MHSIAEILNELRPEFDLSTSQDFISDGMLDSFDIVTLVSSLDKSFSVSIPGTEILPENFTNIQTIEALLRKSGASL